MTQGISGFCPACGAEALEIDDFAQANIRCADPSCPRPELMQQILDIPGKHEHVVEVTDDGWAIEHPIMERVDHSILDCALMDWMRESYSPEDPKGRFVARRSFVKGWVLIPA